MNEEDIKRYCAHFLEWLSVMDGNMYARAVMLRQVNASELVPMIRKWAEMINQGGKKNNSTWA